MPATETDFDRLPEALRLALVESVRVKLAEERGEFELNLSQISEVTAIPITTVNRTYHLALLKLKAEAHKRDL